MSKEELLPAARELVDAARQAQTPNDTHRERAFEALMAGLAGAAPGSHASVHAAKIAQKSAFAWLKWALPVAFVAVAGVGTYAALRRPVAPAASAVTALSAPASVTAPQPATVTAPTPEITPQSASSAVPNASAPSEPSAAPNSKMSTAAKAAPDDLGQELALLHQALAASRSGNAAGALALAQQHARQYPNSKLRVERDAIEVRSLCQLGRAAEAHKIADRLRAQTPSSPVSAALAETCVGK